MNAVPVSGVLEVLNPPSVQRADEAASKTIEYFLELGARRRAEPQEGLISDGRRG
jgi:hypothetical protein